MSSSFPDMFYRYFAFLSVIMSIKFILNALDFICNMWLFHFVKDVNPYGHNTNKIFLQIKLTMIMHINTVLTCTFIKEGNMSAGGKTYHPQIYYLNMYNVLLFNIVDLLIISFCLKRKPHNH